MTPPLLSIITVVYNAKRALLKTYESIEAQSGFDFEWIVIDGGSTDGTLEIISSIEDVPIRWVSELDSGIYDAMNKGIEKAKGEYMQFLNAGDVFHQSSSLESALDILREQKYDLVCTAFEVWSKKQPRPVFCQKPKKFTLENLTQFGTGTCNHQSMFIRRSLTPKYSIKYKLKGELNWYFDLANLSPSLLTHSATKLVLVNYELGGAGNIRYKRNLYEWVLITFKRFGLRQTFNSIGMYKRYLKYIGSVKDDY